MPGTCLEVISRRALVLNEIRCRASFEENVFVFVSMFATVQGTEKVRMVCHGMMITYSSMCGIRIESPSGLFDQLSLV